ncbi:protein ImpA-like [Entelurus aequoreus]|uniref:protein ImpA-like n=1 Tax=Entelurus aequoreus TaxID=161455 RepID=UPI002B1D878D|nr:protein ImpA-like [Entelurus aequoreus]XP_061896293.1 protein ImpA-like [Entelurus aequoreus]
MGFSSPAADYLQKPLTLDNHLIHRPAATFFMTAAGHSMTEAGITDGAILVVDRSLKPVDGDIVVIILDGEHRVRRIRFRNNRVYLQANADVKVIRVNPEQDFEIWGVVSSAVNQYRRN